MLLLGATAASRAADLADQREAFEALEVKVKMGADVASGVASLRDYPLYPYLVYEGLVRRFQMGDREAVAEFLERFADTHLADRLRYRWLQWLHRRHAWDTFLEFYRPTPYTAMTCRHLEALAETGRTEEALARAPEVWLAGESQPDECDPVFALMLREGRLTEDLVWQRIELAMAAGRPSLARYLKRFLPAAQQPLVELWRRVRSRPETLLEDRRLREDGPIVRKIVVYGVQRWARNSPKRAARVWRELSDRYAFSPAERAEAARSLGLYLYRRHPEDARQWLARVAGEPADERVHRARILGSAKAGDWQQTLKWLDARGSDPDDDEDPYGRWQYWRGRALEQLGDRDAAAELFTDLARERSFHGFLAADRLDLEYSLNHRPLVLDDDLAARMAAHPALARIRELQALGRELDARREWHHLRTHLDKDELEAVAEIAHREGWHFHAILALGRSRSWDYLDIRFPLPYRDLVTAKATQRQLDPAWVYAVVRQESAFAPDARSPKGALGLMQLLPSTARSVARSLKTRVSNNDLFEADANISLGTAYLRRLMERFDGHSVLATASYNAGPHRISAWLPEGQEMAADLWIEDIPFHETRKYVQRVFSYTVIYQSFLGNRPERVSRRLKPIPATDGRG